MGGVMEIGSMCVKFSLLEEICLVVTFNAEESKWDLASKDGKVIGCAGDKLQLGSYKEMSKVKRQDIGFKIETTDV